MNVELLENFFSVYEEIKRQYALFIQKQQQKPTISVLKIDNNLTDTQYTELFCSYATDMLIANKLTGKTLFSIDNFAHFNSNFLKAFVKKTQKLNDNLHEFKFSLDDDLGEKGFITTKIFHILGENLVRKDILDSGVVFTPPGVAKLLSCQSMMFYLRKNTTFSIEKILDMVIDPNLTILNGLSESDTDNLYAMLKNIRVLDPACGTGLFFFEMAPLLFHMYEMFPNNFDKVKLTDIFRNNLFGIDINPHIVFKLRFLMQLFLYHTAGTIPENTSFLTTNFLCEDSLLMASSKAKKFDILFGNPPYVRQENIRPQGILNLREPKFLEKSYKESIIQKIKTEKAENFQINKRSDLYIYFFYYALNLLKEKGIVSFLTSNSWLNIGFGFEFQKFVLKNTELCSIIDFDYRAFSSAEINTVITTLCSHTISPKMDTKNHFIKLKTSLESATVSDILRNLFGKRDSLENKYTEKIVERNSPQFQSRQISQNQIVPGTRWGNELLLAPQIYFELKDKIGDKLMRLGEIATITRGITTGLNKFFILEQIYEKDGLMTVKNGYNYQFQIEREYLKPFLNGPKRMLDSILHQEELRHFLLHIPADFDEKSPTYAAEYIKYGKNKEIEQTKGKNKGKAFIGAHNVPTLKGRDKFYSLSIPHDSLGTQIFVQKIFSSKYKVYYSPTDDTIWANNTFYNINLKSEFKEYFQSIVASLLSSITYLSIELNGRRSFGMGALDTATFDIENTMVVDPRQLQVHKLQKMERCVSSISSREFLEVSEEFEKKDRKNLDKIILEHLNLGETQHELYNSIKSLVQQRIKKSQTYKKK